MEVMKYHVKKISTQTLGLLFIMLGVAGLILPILNGTIFLLAGLFLLSVYSPWAKKQLDRIGSLHPKLGHVVIRVERFLGRIFGPGN